MRNLSPLLLCITAFLFIEISSSACRTAPLPGVAAGAAAQTAPVITAGSTATFAEAALVKVRNLEPLEAKTGYFEFENECLALDGGTVTAVARHQDRVLVRYEPPKKKFYGVCPSGTIFFVKASDFATMDERYRANIAGLAAERQLVEQLLTEQLPAP